MRLDSGRAGGYRKPAPVLTRPLCSDRLGDDCRHQTIHAEALPPVLALLDAVAPGDEHWPMRRGFCCQAGQGFNWHGETLTGMRQLAANLC